MNWIKSQVSREAEPCIPILQSEVTMNHEASLVQSKLKILTTKALKMNIHANLNIFNSKGLFANLERNSEVITDSQFQKFRDTL